MTREIVANTDPNVVRIFVVRHGKTDYNAKKIMQGHLDIDMNDEGREQSEKAANHLKDIEFDYIVSSDLIRCVNTARAIAQKQKKPFGNFPTTPDLRERNMGPVQGMQVQDALEKYGPDFKNIGEKQEDLVNRVTQVWEQTFKKAVAENHTNTVLCTHGGVIRAFINHLYNVRGYKLAEGMTFEDLRVPFNTSVTMIDLDKTTGEGLIQNFGSTEHLGGHFVVSNQQLR
ncbi:putative broad-specificity phosphatase [Clavispora lusitaniae]|uniref:Broad-specificity phosphatase n=2 Tax=Clavispora lusitaniae TaxID=36911 RepID=C4XWI4_CLAL4|nr:uncharacterized protein CLUG_00307 [Clavispora lusitaniae ATCC 42720]KAF5213296.1 hypothetical protein E0198_000813 [Clavispora lusitaniae]EEQ36184.1 hypothetical protein CLUG_00307 [Clavispora lusitaniae ATCC 42720]KAF7584236.1 Histidine phosphatase (branch 1) family protein [Clavispora lusitaniae]QFZ25234.1 putative broad-specificity phosphatase [Clavispora lusitaniae]QFZ31463.1 putative broad-specificity phosphatase [Clavispora lusitaniae]